MSEFEQLLASALDETGYDDPERAQKILQAIRQHAGSDDFAIVGGRVMRLEQRGSAHLGRHIHRNQAGTEHVVVTEWNLLGEPQFDCTEPDKWVPLYRLLPSERAE